MKEAIKGFLTDENGVWSSKRLIGIIGGLSIVANVFISGNDLAIESCLILTTASLGLAVTERIFKK